MVERNIRGECTCWLSHASESHLETVIIKFARELVVVFWLCFSGGGSTLTKHGRQIALLSINLHLTAGFSEVTLESMWVNDGLNFLSLIVDEVIGGDKVSLLEDILSLAMSKHDVTLDSSLRVRIHLYIVSVVLLCHDHFLGLWLVIICRCR